MDRDTFTAGVVPGGLTDHAEIKILVCYLLKELGFALSHDDLLEALTGKGYANYFESANALSDLVEAGHIIQAADNSYAISATGKEIAQTLIDDIPLTVRERTLYSAQQLARLTRNRNSHKVSALETELGFRVRCTVNDAAGNVLFAVELDAPNKRTVQRIRENFVAYAEDIMRFSITKLIGEEL